MALKQVSLWGPTFTIPEQAATINKVQAALENPKEVMITIIFQKILLITLLLVELL